MIISLIAAIGKNRVIGKANQLLWHLPNDFKHFKETTLGKPVIMGQRTFESIGKPLPGRQNIVLSQDADFRPEGCSVVKDISSALSLARDSGQEEIFIIGGGMVYASFLPLAQRMYLTLVDASPEGDTYFPEWNPVEWKVVSSEEHPADEQNSFRHTFVTYERTVPAP